MIYFVFDELFFFDEIFFFDGPPYINIYDNSKDIYRAK